MTLACCSRDVYYTTKLKRCGNDAMKDGTVKMFPRKLKSVVRCVMLSLLKQNKTESPTHYLELCSHYGIEMLSGMLRDVAPKPRPRNARNTRLKNIWQVLAQLMKDALKPTSRQNKYDMV